MNIKAGIKNFSLGLKSRFLSANLQNNDVKSPNGSAVNYYYDLGTFRKIVIPKNPITDKENFEKIIQILKSYDDSSLIKFNVAKLVCIYEDNDSKKAIIGYEIPEKQENLDSIKIGYERYINLGILRRNNVVKIRNFKHLELRFNSGTNIETFKENNVYKYLMALLNFIVFLSSNGILISEAPFFNEIVETSEINDVAGIPYLTMNNIHELKVLNENKKLNYSFNLKCYLKYVATKLHFCDFSTQNFGEYYYSKVLEDECFHYLSTQFIDLYKRVFKLNENVDLAYFAKVVTEEFENLAIFGNNVYNRKRLLVSPYASDVLSYVTEDTYRAIIKNGDVKYSTCLYDVITYKGTSYIIYKKDDEESLSNMKVLCCFLKNFMKLYSSSRFDNDYKIFKLIYQDGQEHPIGFMIEDYGVFTGDSSEDIVPLSKYINCSNMLKTFKELYSKILEFYSKDLYNLIDGVGVLNFNKELTLDDIIVDIPNNSLIFRNIENMEIVKKESNNKLSEEFIDFIVKSFISFFNQLVSYNIKEGKIEYIEGKYYVYSMSPYFIKYYESYITGGDFDKFYFFRAIKNTLADYSIYGLNFYSKYVVSPRKLPPVFVDDLPTNDVNILKTNRLAYDEVSSLLKHISSIKRYASKISSGSNYKLSVICAPENIVYYSTVKVSDDFEIYGLKFPSRSYKNYVYLSDVDKLIAKLKYEDRVRAIFDIIMLLLQIINHSMKYMVYIDINSICFSKTLKPYVNLRRIISNCVYNDNYLNQNVLINYIEDKEDKEKEICYKIMNTYVKAINKLYKLANFDVRDVRVGIPYAGSSVMCKETKRIYDFLAKLRNDVGTLTSFTPSPAFLKDDFFVNKRGFTKKYEGISSNDLFTTYLYSIDIVNGLQFKCLNVKSKNEVDFVNFARNLKGINLKNIVYKNVFDFGSDKESIGYLSYESKSRKLLDIDTLSNLEILKCIRGFVKFLIKLKVNHLSLIKGFDVEELISFSTSFKVYVNEIIYLTKEEGSVITPNVKTFLKKYFELAIGFDKERIKLFSTYIICENFENAIAILGEYINSTNKFCIFHNIYYSPTIYGKCPLCGYKVEGYKRSVVEKKPIFSEDGREAIIYDLENGFLGKIYRENDNEESSRNLQNFENKKRVISTLITKINPQDTSMYNFKIPKTVGLILDDETDEFCGPVIEEITNSKPFRILTDRSKVEKYNITLKDKLEILIYLCSAIEFCHINGIYIGDVSHNNVLFNLSTKEVSVIDLDSANIKPGQYTVYTEPFLDPLSVVADTSREGYGYCVSSFEGDYYSLAIMAFYVLTFLHPFNGVYKDENGRVLKQRERMVSRISVLGDYDVIVPPIIEDWSWMSDELVNAFLDIFEKDKRFNIGKYLVNEYFRLYNTKINYISKLEDIEIPVEKEEKKNPDTEDNDDEISDTKNVVLNAFSKLKCNLANIPSKFSKKGIPKKYLEDATSFYECNNNFIIKICENKLYFSVKPFINNLEVDKDEILKRKVIYPKAGLAIPFTNVFLCCYLTPDGKLNILSAQREEKQIFLKDIDLQCDGNVTYPDNLVLNISSINGHNDLSVIFSYVYAIETVIKNFGKHTTPYIFADLITQKWLVVEPKTCKAFLLSMSDKTCNEVTCTDFLSKITNLRKDIYLSNAIYFNKKLFYPDLEKICAIDIDNGEETCYLCNGVTKNSKIEIILKGFRVYQYSKYTFEFTKLNNN